MIHDMQTVAALQRLHTAAEIAGELLHRPGAMEGLAAKLFGMLKDMGQVYGIDFDQQDARMDRANWDPARYMETYVMRWEPKSTAVGIRGTYRDGLHLHFSLAPHTPLRIPAPPTEIWAQEESAFPTATAEPITLEAIGWDNIAREWIYAERRAA